MSQPEQPTAPKKTSKSRKKIVARPVSGVPEGVSNQDTLDELSTTGSVTARAGGARSGIIPPPRPPSKKVAGPQSKKTVPKKAVKVSSAQAEAAPKAAFFRQPSGSSVKAKGLEPNSSEAAYTSGPSSSDILGLVVLCVVVALSVSLFWLTGRSSTGSGAADSTPQNSAVQIPLYLAFGSGAFG